MPGSARRSGPAGRVSTSGSARRRRSPRSSSSARWWAGSVKVRCLAKRAAVAGGELAGVEGDGGELALADRGPRPAARRSGGRASSRWCRSAGRAAAATRMTKRRSRSRASRSGSGRIRSRSSSKALGGDGADGAVEAGVGALFEPAVELVLVVERGWRRCAPARSFARMKPCRRSSMPFAWGSPGSRITQPTPSCTAEGGEGVGRLAAAARGSPPRGPRPASSGSAPSSARQRLMPQRTSGACLEKTSAPAPARE